MVDNDPALVRRVVINVEAGFAATRLELGRLGIAASGPKERSVIPADICSRGMVRPQRFFPDGESALIPRLGFLVAALGFVEERQVVESLGGVGMVRPPVLFHRWLARLSQIRGPVARRSCINIDPETI